MLKHTVRKNLVEDRVAEWQVAPVRYQVRHLDSQLPRYPPGGADAYERWVNADWPVAGLRGGQTPPSPITTDFQEAAALAGGKAKRRHGIFGQLAHQMLIQVAVGGPDPLFHKRIDLAGPQLD